ncbi:hypothetical protein GQ600_20451 [Phytophthora cactorum]|nr:hypothetical protein GQ600_8491 [Phytophthora cactorum]KAF1792479.1 hypothetical protein GQ600_20451 [Phytophthora cactorum]
MGTSHYLFSLMDRLQLSEDTSLGDLLGHFQSTLVDLQHQEPSFWQLQVVGFIRCLPVAPAVRGAVLELSDAFRSNVPVLTVSQDLLLIEKKRKAKEEAVRDLNKALLEETLTRLRGKAQQLQNDKWMYQDVQL